MIEKRWYKKIINKKERLVIRKIKEIIIQGPSRH